MVDRRNLLKISATSVAGGLVNLSGQAFAVTGQTQAKQPLLRAIYDERFQESRAFAEQFALEGAAVSAASEDIAGLWYDDLRVHLLQNGLAPRQ